MRDEWYFRRPDGGTAGPVGWDALRLLAASGDLPPDSVVWAAGRARRPASEVGGLYPASTGGRVGWRLITAAALSCVVLGLYARLTQRTPPDAGRTARASDVPAAPPAARPQPADPPSPPSPPPRRPVDLGRVAGANPFVRGGGVEGGAAPPPARSGDRPPPAGLSSRPEPGTQASAPVDTPVLPAARPNPAAAPDGRPNVPVEERLYLLYKLERLYVLLPTVVDDPAAYAAAVQTVRVPAVRHLRDLRERGFEPAVTSAYADVVAAADDRLDLLVELGRLDRAAADRVKAAADGSGGAVPSPADFSGRTNGDMLLAVAATDFYAALLENIASAQGVPAARRTTQEAAVHGSRRRAAARADRLRAAVAGMAGRLGWPRGTVPVLEPAYTLVELRRRSDEHGLPGILDALDQAAARRPADVFLELESCLVMLEILDKLSLQATQADAEEERARLRKLIRDCGAPRATDAAGASARVPAGRPYDEDRIALWQTAGWLELFAADAGDPNAAARAGRAAAAALTLDPADVAGDLRLLRMFALGAAGDNRTAVAVGDEIAGLREDDARFAYVYAGLLARTGQPRKALHWVRRLYTHCGVTNVAAVRDDQELAALGRHDPAEWGRLTVPDWGVVVRATPDGLAEVILTNRSPFPLTAVTVRPRVPGADWEPSLTVDAVAPGRTHTWAVAGPGPGVRLDPTTAALECDQSGKR